eukprot:s989_g15.t1
MVKYPGNRVSEFAIFRSKLLGGLRRAGNHESGSIFMTRRALECLTSLFFAVARVFCCGHVGRTSCVDMANRHLRPESPQSHVTLSPRFLSLLTEGQTGEGLLRRAFAETQRRAYENWEKKPWASPEQNWLAAERSFVRRVTVQASAGAAGECPSVEVPVQKFTHQADQIHPAVPGEGQQSLVKEMNGVEPSEAAGVDSGKPFKETTASTDIDDMSGKSENHGLGPDKASKKDPDRSASGTSFASCEELNAVSSPSPGDMKGTKSVAFPATEFKISQLGTTGVAVNETKRPKSGAPIESSFSIPKLPLNLVRRSTGQHSQRSQRSQRDGVLWPGTIMEIPPWPEPPEGHPLITPRTGAALPRKEVFSMCTPRPAGASIPSPIQSRSPSVSSEESFLDAYENWDRIGSIETAASQQEVVMTVRSEKASDRSNFSLYGLYGSGQDAEAQVLRKVICDLETRLQEQEQELQAWRCGQRRFAE